VTIQERKDTLPCLAHQCRQELAGMVAGHGW
jgi:hypothetical protein